MSALESRYHWKRLTDLCLSSRPTPAAGPVRNPEQPEFSPPRYGQSDLLRCMSQQLAQSGGWRRGRASPLCPGSSDINLFRYCQGVIDLDAEISDRAFDLGMPEQQLDSPQVARPPID